MKDNNVKTMLRFSKEKGVEDLRIDQNYIITISWKWALILLVKICVFLVG